MPDHSAYQMTHINRTSQPLDMDYELAIENLVREHYPYIQRLTFSILDNKPEAEDAAQETFIAAQRSLKGFRKEADPKTWLTAIAVNICRGRLRKRKVYQSLTTALQELHLMKQSSPTPEQIAIHNELNHRIWHSVDNLDEKHRIPVILHYVHGYDVSEIARILQLSQGTIHSRLHYARRKLYAQLEHPDSQEEVPNEPIQ